MKKQEILDRFEKQIVIENYSLQTRKTYISNLKLFLEYIENLKTKQVTEENVRNYLFLCATKRKYSYFSMKHRNLSIKMRQKHYLIKQHH